MYFGMAKTEAGSRHVRCGVLQHRLNKWLRDIYQRKQPQGALLVSTMCPFMFVVKRATPAFWNFYLNPNS